MSKCVYVTFKDTKEYKVIYAKNSNKKQVEKLFKDAIRLEEGGIQKYCRKRYYLKPLKIVDDKGVYKDFQLRKAFEMAKSGSFYLVAKAL